VKSRDIVIGFIFLVILIAGVLWIFKSKNKKIVNTPLPTPDIVQRIDNAFPNIPNGVERANLSDVTGGNSLGVATRTEVVANLPELTNGEHYNVLIENSSGNSINLGNMRISKSGYILEYSSSRYQSYNKVIVNKGNTHILEGSF